MAKAARNDSDHGIEWWRMACERSSQATAFVGMDDRFRYTNQAWCRLVGWSAMELRTKRWQDITDMDDISPDEAETSRVRDGKTTEYYMEKVYIRPSGERIRVSVYVHRFPPNVVAKQMGFVVFASPVDQHMEYRDLKAKYELLERAVNEVSRDHVALQNLAEQARQNRELIRALVSKGEVKMGDVIGGDKTGGNKITNEAKLVIAVVIAVASVLVWAMYYFVSNPNLQPPPNMPAAEPQSRLELHGGRDAIVNEALKAHE